MFIVFIPFFTDVKYFLLNILVIYFCILTRSVHQDERQCIWMYAMMSCVVQRKYNTVFQMQASCFIKAPMCARCVIHNNVSLFWLQSGSDLCTSDFWPRSCVLPEKCQHETHRCNFKASPRWSSPTGLHSPQNAWTWQQSLLFYFMMLKCMKRKTV